jgi:hypothetical protein
MSVYEAQDTPEVSECHRTRPPNHGRDAETAM